MKALIAADGIKIASLPRSLTSDWKSVAEDPLDLIRLAIHVPDKKAPAVTASTKSEPKLDSHSNDMGNRSLHVCSLRSFDSNRESIAADPLDLVKLAPLMERTSDRPEIVIGLIDGPVAIDHPDLAGESVSGFPGKCALPSSIACMHGTFVAGILSARRGSVAPSICPGCAVLVCPIFSETVSGNELIPSAPPEELATSIITCIDAGARLLNLSAALAQVASAKGERALAQAFDYAAKRGVIVVAAAGNQGTIGSTVITRLPWVISVTACDRRGRPLNESNLGRSIGRHGLSAPGECITSLGTDGRSLASGGTSVAAPFVTGAIALVWSEFPNASGRELRMAVTDAHPQKRQTVVPPLLNALSTYNAMNMRYARGKGDEG